MKRDDETMEAYVIRLIREEERERCAAIARSIGGENGEHVATAIEMGAVMTPTRPR